MRKIVVVFRFVVYYANFLEEFGVHKINKENLAAVRADSKANFAEATKPDPDFERFKNAQGLGNKVKVVVDNIKEGAKEAGRANREQRDAIRTHEAYQTVLEEQRKKRQESIM